MKLWLAAIGMLLLGYAFADKGFAYVGVAPLYVGDIVLLSGIAVAFASPAHLVSIFRSPVCLLLLLFALLGLSRTVPFLPLYGLNSLRDAALWGYGGFAVLLSAALFRSNTFYNIPALYRRCILPLLLWTPFVSILQLLRPSLIPIMPGKNVPVILLKGGDVAVHLAGILGFLVLGMHAGGSRRAHWLKNVFPYLFWMCAFLMVATGRSAIVTVLCSTAVLFVLYPKAEWETPLLVCTAFAIALSVANFRQPLTTGRYISTDQVLVNLRSISGNTGTDILDGTRQWRLLWWRDIVHYTFKGRYFWTGKGFGINLADDDGFQVATDNSLRSPHSSHMTVLARMGVPGLLLWVALQGTFAASLLRAYFTARRRRLDWWAKLDVFILAYWTAFMVNASFDVYLEGPQGGIWFWCLIGFGIAAVEIQRKFGSCKNSRPIRYIRVPRHLGQSRLLDAYADSAREQLRALM